MFDLSGTACDAETDWTGSPASSAPQASAWTVVIPFHNEAGFLQRCLASLARQTVVPRVVLVDNGSTDGSGQIARNFCAAYGIDALHLFEARPGKVAALARGMAAVTTEFVATWDADTIYPRDYLQVAERLLARRAAVAAVAATTGHDAPIHRKRLAGWRLALTARVLRQQCLNGGAGQVFRTAALRECGGFDPAIWNWVLEDHEIMARIEVFGRIEYGRDFICHPSDRPKSVQTTGWTLAEQIRYHLSSSGDRVGFFHQFLAGRLHARAMSSDKLRYRPETPLNA